MKRIIAVIGLTIIGAECAFAQISSNFAPLHAYQAQTTLACAKTMTNILKDIAKIAPEFPPLSEIGSASIEAWGSTDAPTYLLIYRKNAHMVFPPISKNAVQSSGVVTNANNLRPRVDTLVVDSGGIDLEIALVDIKNSRAYNASGKYYSLLTVNGWDKFSLNYYLSLNAPDDRLENTLSNIVETNVTLLRSNLQKIIGANPESTTNKP